MKTRCLVTLLLSAVVGCSGAQQSAQSDAEKNQPAPEVKPKAPEPEGESPDQSPQRDPDEANKEPVTAKPDQTKSEDPPADDPESKPADKGEEVAGAKTHQATRKHESEAGSKADPGEQPETAQAPKPAPLIPERIVMLTSRGPVIIDLVLSIDGKPHEQALQRLVDHVLKTGDTNGDGRATWREVFDSPRFKYGQMGNAPINNEGERANALRLYDINRNGKVDRDEVPRFLTRNAGGSRSFDFRSSNYYRDLNKDESPVRDLLDFDEDRRVTKAELANAYVRLISRDADGDGVLFASEVVNPTEERPGALSRRRKSVPDSAARLTGRPNWSVIQYTMEEYYCLGAELDESAFRLTPSLFKELDADEDGTIDKDEFLKMADVEPHLRVEAHFGDPQVEKSKADDDAGNEEESEKPKPDGDDPDSADAKDDREPAAPPKPKPRLRLTFLHSDLGTIEEVATISERRITLKLPGDELMIFFNDMVAAENNEQRAQGLLNQYDADKNQYIDEDEAPDNLPGVQGGFEAIDADNDKKIYLKEIAQYFANSRVAIRSQIRCRAGDLPDAWFDALDITNDGRLDARELMAAKARLEQLDEDGDGELGRDEIPGSLTVGIVRGDPQQMEQLFAIPVDRPEVNGNAPRWFLRMDVNSDGAISRLEFLGNNEQFKKLDANLDGFLTPNEVGAPEKPAKDPEATKEPKPDEEEKQIGA